MDCKTGRQMGIFAHIPPEAFPLYDGHKGKKFCCKEQWGVMIQKLVQLVSPLPSTKRGRLEDAASPPSTLIATRTTAEPLPNGFEERDVILWDACAKYPSKHEYDMDSNFFTGSNTIRRYYLGAPVFTSKTVPVCDACEKDLTNLRRAIDKVCVRHGTTLDFPKACQLPARCVSQASSPVVQQMTKKRKERRDSCVSATQVGVPVTARSLFVSNKEDKQTQTEGMHCRCRLPDTSAPSSPHFKLCKMLLQTMLQRCTNCVRMATLRTLPLCWTKLRPS